MSEVCAVGLQNTQGETPAPCGLGGGTTKGRRGALIHDRRQVAVADRQSASDLSCVAAWRMAQVWQLAAEGRAGTAGLELGSD
jgi:hypothetical protein